VSIKYPGGAVSEPNIIAQGQKPSALYELRKRIDGQIGNAFGKQSNEYISALKALRSQMRRDLEDTAVKSGNPEYVDAMRTLSKKYDAIDRLEGYLGKSEATQKGRAQGFVDRLMGENSGARQEIVADLDELFGKDFSNRARLAQLAQEIGPVGKPGTPALIPKHMTGRSALAPIVGGVGFMATGANNPAWLAALPLSSPAAQSELILPVTEGIKKSARYLLPAVPSATRQARGK
jgi:hypothetical protein